MKEGLNGCVNENMVVESNIYIEDTRFSILSDRGLLTREIPENYVYNNDGETPLHIHLYYELAYTDSPMNTIFEDKTVNHENNRLIIIPPSLPHAMQRIGHNYDASVFMNFSLKKFASVPGFSLYNTLTEILAEPLALEVPQRAAEIMRRFDSSHPETVINDRFLTSQNFHELITIILKSANRDINPGKSVSVTDSNASRAYMITMMISNHFNTDITAEQVAQKLKISTRQVSRIINSTYGKTFKELICDLRMKRAVKLLTTTDKTVAEIAGEVGYNASKGFYNAFKKYYGCLPTEYRKKQTENK
ncbi:MAG: helix-turn-helix transcriptional regulator [Clostridia bacterium]|nr:helix-turn-helix transcriptional regulator [Clostridia bacterium]